MRSRGIVCLTMAVSLGACSGGEVEHPPSLSAFTLSPATLPQDGTLSVWIAFEDADGDLVAIDFTLTDRRTGAAETQRASVPGAAGIVSGTLRFGIDASMLPPSPYVLEATLVDATGARSGPLAADFHLYGGFRGASTNPLPREHVYLGDTAVGDLDGDGRVDVAAMEFTNAGNRVYVYRQTAQGTLASPPDEIATGLSLRGLAVGDVDGDGLADLVVCGTSQAGAASPVVLVYVHDEISGGLSAPRPLPVGESGGVAIADLDGDHRNDVVIGSLSAISVSYQDSTGALAAPVAAAQGLGAIGGEVHVGDMDGDGRLDIVVQSGMKQMAVVRQTAVRTFATPDVYDVLTSYWPNVQAFAVGDVNGDGRADLAVTDPGNGGYLNVFLQTNHGTLAGPIARNPGFDMPAGIEIADVDGDGLDDLVFDSGGGAIAVAHQRADHVLPDVYWYGIPAASFGGTMVRQGLSVADVTGDGWPDLVVSWMDEGVFVVPHL
jgi:hypothetical protein